MKNLRIMKLRRNSFANLMPEVPMSPSAYWTISSTGDAAIRCGRLRLQQAVAVSSSWHWVPRAMTWRVSDLK